MSKKVSYISLLKEAVGEYTKIPQTVDAKGPMVDDILGYEGTGELKTRKDAASILERYYFKEEDAGPDKPVSSEEPDNEPLGDKAETKDGQGGGMPKDEIEDELALGDTDGTLKEDDETASDEAKEDDKEDDKDDKKEIQEAFNLMLEEEDAAAESKEDEGSEEDKKEDEKEEKVQEGTPLAKIAKNKEGKDSDAAEREVYAESAESLVLSKLIEQMEATSAEPDTEPAGDPETNKDGRADELDVDTALKDVKNADDVKAENTAESASIEEMFSLFREQVEAEDKKEDEGSEEDKKEDEKEEEVKEDAQLESLFMEDEDAEEKKEDEDSEDKDSEDSIKV